MFPGQGSQYKGMGKELFPKYKMETKLASEILQYDIEELCVSDPNRQLVKTQYTQPALYVVNYFRNKELDLTPDYVIGHSLGEFNALAAAGGFDFETGLRLVQKRGRLMADASGGSMAAVLGLKIEELKERMSMSKYADLDIANYNTPSQTVISGPLNDIKEIVKDFSNQNIRIVPLQVSAPFHSRYMEPAAREFSEFLKGFSFSDLKIPVISNVTARPYENGRVAELLSSQITGSVRWFDSIRYLMGKNVTDYKENGRGVLTRMVTEIRKECTPIIEEEFQQEKAKTPIVVSGNQETLEMEPSKNRTSLATKLGSASFRKDYGIDYCYVAGSMYKGTASKELVIRMGKAKMLSFLGTGGLSLQRISEDIDAIQNALQRNEPYGMNLLHNLNDPNFEMKTVELYLEKGVESVEASAYMQITEALVYFHTSGFERRADGTVMNKHRILAKVSRPEVAESFMKPAPEKLVNRLLEAGRITKEQMDLAKDQPMSYDICVEADSGGHTDSGVAMVLLPSIQRLREDIQKKYQYSRSIRVGLAGGIGTPESAASAFVMGADFVLTGSINQCTVEAKTSDAVKDLLEGINVQDTGYAPSGDMFEIGSKVQVLKKGVLFPARANKLYALYSQYNSLEDIPEKTILQLEKNYFKKTIPEIWEDTKRHFMEQGKEEEIAKAEQRPRHKMGLIFRWYFGFSTRMAFSGNLDNKVDFQIHTGPALGAFNQWVKGSEMERWRNRHVDEIGEKLMEATGELLHDTLIKINQNKN